MLVANGENVKVIQELMRHASSRSTLEIYSQARTADKRAPQQRLIARNDTRRLLEVPIYLLTPRNEVAV